MNLPTGQNPVDAKKLFFQQDAVNAQISAEQAPETTFKTLEQVEKEHILKALEFAGGSKTKAAALLGVSVKTVYNKLSVYGV